MKVTLFVQPREEETERTSWQLLHDREGREGGVDTSDGTRKCHKAASRDAQIGYWEKFFTKRVTKY